MPYVIAGRSVQLEDEPKNLNGPIYVPLRQVMDQIGGQTTFENSTKTAGATLGGRHVRVDADSPNIQVDGQDIGMSVAAFMDGSQFWVPLEFFQKAFGSVVAIGDATTNTVTVNT